MEIIKSKIHISSHQKYQQNAVIIDAPQAYKLSTNLIVQNVADRETLWADEKLVASNPFVSS